jgi:hypothetical protein
MTGVPLSDLGGNAPYAKFERLGETFAGTISRVSRQQQTEFGTRTPAVWANGDPKMQLVVELTLEDGERCTLYASGGNFKAATGEGESMEKAIALAAMRAGADTIEPGARLAVKFTGQGEPTKPGLNAPRLFTAQYQPPAPPSVGVEDLFGGEG